MGNFWSLQYWFPRTHKIPVSSPSSGSTPRTRSKCPDPYPPTKLEPRSLNLNYSTPGIGPILKKPYIDINSVYKLDKELGRGQFGVTYLCTKRATGKKYACKVISRRKLKHEMDVEDVRMEIMVLEHLSGQPNIVEFEGAYEDRNNNVYIIMELCRGGELFDRIVSKGNLSEREAARVFRDIVMAVHACHTMGVIHRDLKPENFLFVSKDDDSPLKIIDFGVSIFIEPGKIYMEPVGTPYYIAPEVLQRRYGKEIDVWSAGIILYILLSGAPPFCSETEKGLFNEILQGNLDLESLPWPSISEDAKDLISRMLRDPKTRITAEQALEHPWLRKGSNASDRPIDRAVLIRMRHFRAINKLKKLALKVVAENLSEEIQGLKEMFINIDTDRSGSITVEELKIGLARLGSNSRLNENKIEQLMDAADVDKTGSIDYVEFITAAMDRHRLDKEENLTKAFRYLDRDNSGFVTRDELRVAMAEHGMGDEATIDEILDDVVTNKDGIISFEEFMAMMRKGMIDTDGVKNDVFVLK